MEELFDKVVWWTQPFDTCLQALPPGIKEATKDVHFKGGQPITLHGRYGVLFLGERGGVVFPEKAGKNCKICTPGELQALFLQLCGHSVFSHQQEMLQGYISVGNGLRVGIAGTAVLEQGVLKSVKEITSLSLRIPREARGCGDDLFRRGVPLEKGLLLVGPPSSGKTTVLRDLIRSLSTGRWGLAQRVAVIDEKHELSGAFDLGPCADVLRGYPKKEGLDIAVRTLSPQFVVCDELGLQDSRAVAQSVFTGVSLVASVHGTREDFLRRPLCKTLLATGAFCTLAFLEGAGAPGRIQQLGEVTADGTIHWGDSAGGKRRPAGGDGGREAKVPGAGAA